MPHLWYWDEASTNGDYTIFRNYDTEHRCNCPQKYGPYTADVPAFTNAYTAVCQGAGWITANDYHYTPLNNSASANWVRSHECPKGWGKYYDDPASKSGPYVQCAQGYVVDGEQGDPIYGYVTRYRDVYYDYISTRISKI